LDPSKDGASDAQMAHGASCLEFEPTIPTKFMVGTDRGDDNLEIKILKVWYGLGLFYLYVHRVLEILIIE